MRKRNPFSAHRFPSTVVPLLFAVLILAACSDDGGVGPVDNPGIPEIEQRVHTLVNQYRVEQGLAPLSLSDIITTQARNHSSDMADGSVQFGHDGFQDRVDAISAQISISSAAENVARNSGYSDPAKVAFDGWIKSAGHKDNIEGNYDLTGIGVAQSSEGVYYLTQIFAKSR